MDKQTVKLLEAFRDMDTTAKIAAELDKVIDEVGNIDSSKEMVAAVLIAAGRAGVMTLSMLDTKQ